jgi:hypothetical protein
MAGLTTAIYSESETHCLSWFQEEIHLRSLSEESGDQAQHPGHNDEVSVSSTIFFSLSITFRQIEATVLWVHKIFQPKVVLVVKVKVSCGLMALLRNARLSWKSKNGLAFCRSVKKQRKKFNHVAHRRTIRDQCYKTIYVRSLKCLQ